MKAFIVGILIILAVLIFGGGFLLRESFNLQNADQILQSPTAIHWFGTDSLGRDYFSRVLIGGQFSILISLVSLTFSILMGSAVGVILALSGKKLNFWSLRVFDIYQSIPNFILLALLTLFFQNLFGDDLNLVLSLLALSLSIGLCQWIVVARLVRAEVLQILNEEFILASRALGATSKQVVTFHILRVLKEKCFFYFGLFLPTHLFYESFLGFVGFGLRPPWTSWGLLIQEGWKNLSQSSHLMVIPLIFLVTFVWLVNLLLHQKKSVQE